MKNIIIPNGVTQVALLRDPDEKPKYPECSSSLGYPSGSRCSTKAGNCIRDKASLGIIIGILFIVASFSGCVSDKFNKEITPLKGKGVKAISPNVTGTYDDLKWQRCIELHGHECAGLAIGFRAAEAVIEKLHLTFSKDEKLVCVTETNT